MNFATLAYAGFLLAVVVIHWLLPRSILRRWFLILASLAFFGTWNWVYVPGFAALVVANFGLGLLAARPGRERLAVRLAILANLGILCVFKYADWVVGSAANLWVRLVGGPAPFEALGIILPLAVSFVTFTQLAYVIDTARGARPERQFSRYALFVTFFPHLIAGPIMRGHEFLPQVRHPRPFRVEFIRLALPLLVVGLLKKTVGDALGPVADRVFADPASFSTPALWVGVFAFTFQILLDFSGYTDMALGSAQLLGYQLPRNFDWPYRSLSIQEFWRRWHMTLSRWLRDYVYISLGGNRKGTVRTYVNLFLTMLIGGLWHGANLTFIAWGGWHGAGLVTHRYWSTHFGRRIRIPPPVAWATTFLFVVVGWVFFRAGSIESALAILARMVVPHGGAQSLALALAGLLALGFALGQWPRLQETLRRLAPDRTYRRYAAYGLLLVAAVAMVPAQTVAFIYFQF